MNTDLRRPRVSCSCSDCFNLNIFLVESQSRVRAFPLAKRRRQHLHQQLDAARIDCTHETERRGSPQSLIVTKTFKGDVSRKAKWDAACKLARQNFAKFEQTDLRRLLGDQYDAITSLRIVSREGPGRSNVASSTQPLASTSISNINQAPTQMAGTKRRADDTDTSSRKKQIVVIDLKDD